MIKTSSREDSVCVAKVHEADQDHVFEHWDELDEAGRKALLAQLRSVDFQQLKHLVQTLVFDDEPMSGHVLSPPEVDRLPSGETDVEELELCRSLGEYALRQGEAALVTCAGRAGVGALAEPVGFLPVGPVTGKSVFQLHAETVMAQNRRHKISLRWYIFTPPAQLEMTAAYFKSHSYFGLNCSDIHFLAQDILPVVDRRGKLLLSAPGCVAMEPTGHGSILEALVDDETLGSLRKAGVRYLSYFQADNPLARIVDPVFLGYHIRNRAEISSKCVRKVDPGEPVGVFCRFDGSLGVVEYTELDPEDRVSRNEDGSLRLWAGNIASHVFGLEFLERYKADGTTVPFHAVPHTCPHVNKRGRLIRPTDPNSYRFQTYVFDALRETQRSTLIEVERLEEFSPIKNTGGKRSPQTAQRDLSQLYASWLSNACARLEPGARKKVDRVVEISPLYAIDGDELKEKIEEPVDLTSDVLL